ncbi:hypothetical protein C8R46DRAFT_1050308 [Mycena filopes]|nr:hypothetical protein C8R46DRAFT_1050308 [Mycena filopes]
MYGCHTLRPTQTVPSALPARSGPPSTIVRMCSRSVSPSGQVGDFDPAYFIRSLLPQTTSSWDSHALSSESPSPTISDLKPSEKCTRMSVHNGVGSGGGGPAHLWPDECQRNGDQVRQSADASIGVMPWQEGSCANCYSQQAQPGILYGRGQGGVEFSKAGGNWKVKGSWEEGGWWVQHVQDQGQPAGEGVGHTAPKDVHLHKLCKTKVGQVNLNQRIPTSPGTLLTSLRNRGTFTRRHPLGEFVLKGWVLVAGLAVDDRPAATGFKTPTYIGNRVRDDYDHTRENTPISLHPTGYNIHTHLCKSINNLLVKLPFHGVDLLLLPACPTRIRDVPYAARNPKAFQLGYMGYTAPPSDGEGVETGWDEQVKDLIESIRKHPQHVYDILVAALYFWGCAAQNDEEFLGKWETAVIDAAWMWEWAPTVPSAFCLVILIDHGSLPTGPSETPSHF